MKIVQITHRHEHPEWRIALDCSLPKMFGPSPASTSCGRSWNCFSESPELSALCIDCIGEFQGQGKKDQSVSEVRNAQKVTFFLQLSVSHCKLQFVQQTANGAQSDGGQCDKEQAKLKEKNRPAYANIVYAQGAGHLRVTVHYLGISESLSLREALLDGSPETQSKFIEFFFQVRDQPGQGRLFLENLRFQVEILI